MRYGAIALITVLGGAAVAAEADDLYESLGDLQLGRVFLTPGERERLEARRGMVIAEDSTPNDAEEGGASPAAVKQRPAAGIIVAAGGRPLVWIDGEFRRVDSASIEEVEFPGVVSIRIHGAPGAARIEDEPAAMRDNAAAGRSIAEHAEAPVAGGNPDDAGQTIDEDN